MPHEDALNEDAGPAVRWEQLGQKRFDRLVEALVLRQHGPTAQVQPIDGRGGDDGVDIWVTERGHRTVWQLKYFPEGFDGRYRDRRQQIKKSLTQALEKNDFDEWVLVMSGTPTKSGWAWWGKLAKDHPGLRMRLVTRAQLDDWCARNPDVVNSLHSRDYVLQKAAIMSQEKAVLAGGSADLTGRVAALGAVVDHVDDAWTLDFARQGDTIVHTLRAKDTLAASLHPIRVHVGVAGSTEDPQLREFDRALRYGTFEAVTVRSDLIQKFEVTGSALVATEGIPDFFQIDRATDGAESSALQLRFLDDSGKSMGVHRGKVEQVAGSGGGRIRQRFYDRLTVTWTLDFENTSTVDVQIELDALLEQEVGNAKRLGQLLLAWCAGGRLSPDPRVSLLRA